MNFAFLKEYDLRNYNEFCCKNKPYIYFFSGEIQLHVVYKWLFRLIPFVIESLDVSFHALLLKFFSYEKNCMCWLMFYLKQSIC